MKEPTQMPSEKLENYRRLIKRRSGLEDEYNRRWRAADDRHQKSEIEWFVNSLDCNEEDVPPCPSRKFLSDVDESEYAENRESYSLTLDQIAESEDQLGHLVCDALLLVACDEKDMYGFSSLRQETSPDRFDEDSICKFDQLYQPRVYSLRKRRLPQIVLFVGVPGEMVELLDEAREAYCLGLKMSCVSLCRTFLESATNDIFKRSGIANYSNARGLADRLDVLLPSSDSVADQLWEKINKVKRTTNRVIHATKRVSDGDAMDTLVKVQAYVQTLYSIHHDRFHGNR